MAIESTSTRHESIADSSGSRPSPNRVGAFANRWVQLGIGVATVTIFAISIVLLRSTTEPKRELPSLTHTVTRGPLVVTVLEHGTLESSENTEIKSNVRGSNTVLWVIESGSYVKKGDVLLRMDTAFIEEQIDERTKYAHWSRSGAERSAAWVRSNKLAIEQYEKGEFVKEKMMKEKELVIAKSRLRTTKNILRHKEQQALQGYVSKVELRSGRMAQRRAELRVAEIETELEVLIKYQKAERLQSLKGNYIASKATHEANAERAIADGSRRDRAVEELPFCTVRAPRDGLVIHPKAARWRNAPDIAEGANVWKTQVLLLMPDLNKMQVKIGVHESMIKRVTSGLKTNVTVTDRNLIGSVDTVASVTSPPVWWKGNQVRYDTTIKLPKREGLMPGMSAEVEIIVAEYENVLSLPVAAIVQEGKQTYCWVKDGEDVEKRNIELGDTNDVFTIVQSGLEEGEQVILHPDGINESKTDSGSQDSSDSKQSPKATDVATKS